MVHSVDSNLSIGVFSSHPSFLYPKMDLRLNSTQPLPQLYNSFTSSLSKEKPRNASMRNVQSVPGVLGWESGDSKLYFYGSITFLSTYKTNSKGKFLCITLLWKQHISWKFRHTFIAMLEPLKPSVLDSHQGVFSFWPRWTFTPWPPWARPLAAMQVSTQKPPSLEGSPTLSSHPLHTADFIFSSWLHTEILVRLCSATRC